MTGASKPIAGRPAGVRLGGDEVLRHGLEAVQLGRGDARAADAAALGAARGVRAGRRSARTCSCRRRPRCPGSTRPGQGALAVTPAPVCHDGRGDDVRAPAAGGRPRVVRAQRPGDDVENERRAADADDVAGCRTGSRTGTCRSRRSRSRTSSPPPRRCARLFSEASRNGSAMPHSASPPNAQLLLTLCSVGSLAASSSASSRPTSVPLQLLPLVRPEPGGGVGRAVGVVVLHRRRASRCRAPARCRAPSRRCRRSGCSCSRSRGCVSRWSAATVCVDARARRRRRVAGRRCTAGRR